MDGSSKEIYRPIIILLLFSLTLFSSLILSSSVSANDAVIDDISIRVQISCTLSGTGMTSHTTTVNPGTYETNIGTTTLKAYCNDNEGFAIYAIGYTDKMDGKNVLASSTLGSDYDIATGTLTSGNSQWAMKLATQTSPTPTYPITIENSYNNYHTVPTDYELVAKRTAGTDVGTEAIGSTLTTTYQVYASTTQPADTYEGKVKYVMIHSNDYGSSSSPQPSYPGKISYYPNANGATPDTMDDQTVSSTATTVDLWASNFKRPGYGFAGWSTTYDYSDPNGFYGPNETIDDSTTAGANTLSAIQSSGLSLYAYWIKSAGSIQNWTCPDNTTMPIGTVTALTDQRDYNTYAVAKLADGKCWMVENLRLDYTNLDNSTGVMAQGYGGQFAGLAQPEIANFSGSSSSVSESTPANSLYYAGQDQGNLGATINILQTNYVGSRMPRYRNDNTNTNSTINPNTTVANMTETYQNVYSYGNYYTWPAALANTNYYNSRTATVDGKTSETVNTSLCPSGWRLPYGRNSGNGNTPGGFYYLNYKINNNSNVTDATASKKIRSYPNNFVYSGYASDSSVYFRGSNGYYWTSTTNTSYGSLSLSLNSTTVSPGTNVSNRKFEGYSIRCVALPST